MKGYLGGEALLVNLTVSISCMHVGMWVNTCIDSHSC